MDGSGSRPKSNGSDEVPNSCEEKLYNEDVKKIENIALDEEEEDEEKVEWDGSEAEMVVDEDVEEFEDEYSGIKLSYTLSDEEIEDCVDILKDRIKARSKKKRTKDIIKAVVLLVVCAVFAVSYFMGYGIVNLIMAIVCLVVLAVLWFMPGIYLSSLVSEKVFKGTYNIKIYPDEVEVNKENKWIIPMDEESEFKEEENMMIILTKKNHMLPIPIRAIEPSMIADVQGILFTGTKPFKE